MKKIIITLLVGIFSFVIFLFLGQNSYPSSPLYNFKRIYEKIVLTTKSDSSEKADYYIELLDKRVAEISHSTKKEYHFYILSSSLRYSTTVGEATQFITTNNLTDKAVVLRSKLDAHKDILENTILKFKGFGNDKTYLQDAVNYINIYQNSINTFCKKANNCASS